jgi:hypothetical protein
VHLPSKASQCSHTMAAPPQRSTHLLGDELRHARAHALRHVRNGQLVVLAQVQKGLHHLPAAQQQRLAHAAHKQAARSACQGKLLHQLLVVALRGRSALLCGAAQLSALPATAGIRTRM